MHLGVDNLGVVRHVGRLLDGKTASRPAEFKDGDLILLIERMLRLWGWTRFVFLKLRVMLMRPWFGLGALVILIGLVKKGADEAADFGGRRCLGGLLMLGVIILGFVHYTENPSSLASGWGGSWSRWCLFC